MPTVEELSDQINKLHDTFEAKGTNSRGVTDVNGNQFLLPVDEEHKAKVFGMGIIFKGIARECRTAQNASAPPAILTPAAACLRARAHTSDCMHPLRPK